MQVQSSVENKRGILLTFIAIAYIFSMSVRMYWPIYFIDEEIFRYAGQLMINTNDGYFFATGARDIIDGVVAEDAQRASAFAVSQGLVLLSAYAAKLLPVSLETVILYLPAVISSLVVIPIVLTGRLMGHTLLGFFAALLGSIAWSYYNRTMAGYYDTDMFSVFLQFTILYTLLFIVYKKELRGILLTAVFMFAYPYFYPQGMTIIYAMYIVFSLYMIAEYKGLIVTSETSPFKENRISLYGGIILLSIPLMVTLSVEIRAILFVVMTVFLMKAELKERPLFFMAFLFFVAFLVFGNVFSVIIDKLLGYLHRGIDVEGLHFYQVVQTVREAGAIPFETMANRISGSQLGVIVSLIGYLFLIVRHKPFVIALPLIGVGVLSLWAGLRFTVYAVPVAAISAIYLFHIMTTFISKKKTIYIFAMSVLTAIMLYPNIMHVIGYKVPTVLNKTEVEDLEKLKKISNNSDYTLAWWDYGYPIWYYSNTNTLIDGGKHTKDNFIISKIMQTDSPQLVANLGRLAVETYVSSNYAIVANTIFNNMKEDQRDPNVMLAQLTDYSYPLPAKTRDIYLYLPYKMLNIFPTVAVFGNLDLTTGKPERNIAFYPTNLLRKEKDIFVFRNGTSFNVSTGELTLGRQKSIIKSFIATQRDQLGSIKVQSQAYNPNGTYMIVYMKSYGTFIIMDEKTFNSTYVQMFILGKYDKSLFELIVSSPYSKIYKLKK